VIATDSEMFPVGYVSGFFGGSSRFPSTAIGLADARLFGSREEAERVAFLIVVQRPYLIGKVSVERLYVNTQ